MSAPSGAIVDRQLLARACGCVCEFRYAARDKYRAERLAKFLQTRCPACVAQLEAERRLAVAARPAKDKAVGCLPLGTHFNLLRRPDGLWAGTLTADSTTVDAVADAPQFLPATLAQLWAVARTAGGAA